MNSVLPFVIIGITTGAVYGLASTGLVLTYRTTGIFNFAQGAVAAAAAYLFYWLHVLDHLPWLLAGILSVFVLGPAAGLGLEAFGKHLSRRRPAMQIVGMIGAVLVVEGLATVKFGSDALSLPQFLPGGSKTFRLSGANVSYAQVTILVISLVAVAGLYWLFRFSAAGTAMRAVVDDPDLVELHGSNSSQIRRLAWMIGTTFAALSGVLIAPTLGIQAITLTWLVVQAFGAAAVGRFNSIPLTYAGALLLGIASSVATKYVVTVSWLSGLPSTLPFIVLIIALLVTSRDKLVMPTREVRRLASSWKAPGLVRLASAVPILVVLALVPLFAGTKLLFFTNGVSQAILLLSLGLLVRTGGMVSLGHAAFAAIGAVAFSQFDVGLHIPWLLAVLLGGLVVVPVAAVLALPAIRLSGLFLALATLGFGLAVEQLLYPRGFMFTPVGDGRIMPRPDFAGGDKAFYFVVLAFFVVVAAGMEVVHRARLGRMLRGLSEAGLAVTTLGLKANVTRVVVFCISGFLAGVAGILYGCSIHTASSSDSHYSAFYSLVILAILALSPFSEPWYAIMAIVAAIIPGYWTNQNAANWLNVVFGVFALQIGAAGGAMTMPESLRVRLDALVARWRPAGVAASPGHVPVRSPVPSAEAGAGLEVRDLSVRYGGNQALKAVSLSVPSGRITSLIGPNGAGKTTLFNAASGLVRPTSGRVLLDGREVTSSSPSVRALRGLGRTFQIMQLGDSLSVFDNVMLGREATQAGARLTGQLVATRPARRLATASTLEALDLCGIADIAARPAGALSTGQRRLVELARCLAGPFRVLLLDEPSSGLSPDETEVFAERLRNVVAERGVGVLLVEHDMSLIMGVSQYVYVLDFGTLIFEGTPEEAAGSAVVQQVYLGTELTGAAAEVELERS